MASGQDAPLSVSTSSKETVLNFGVNKGEEDEKTGDEEGEDYENWHDEQWNHHLTGTFGALVK
jgi:hypothetical protein